MAAQFDLVSTMAAIAAWTFRRRPVIEPNFAAWAPPMVWPSQSRYSTAPRTPACASKLWVPVSNFVGSRFEAGRTL
jgi:hypothetical protein